MTATLKNILARSTVSKTDKILLILSTRNNPIPLSIIREIGVNLGFRDAQSMNVNTHLRGCGGKAVFVPDGWELTEHGKEYLSGKGYIEETAALTPLLMKVQQYVSQIRSVDTKAFLAEAIECANRRLFRAAVVLSWVGAVSVLNKFVFDNHLASFNKEAIARSLIKNPIKNLDGFSKIKEADFLILMESIHLVSNDEKKELVICLGRRNSCGHPNNIQVSEPAVANHLDSLSRYVFNKFA